MSSTSSEIDELSILLEVDTFDKLVKAYRDPRQDYCKSVVDHSRIPLFGLSNVLDEYYGFYDNTINCYLVVNILFNSKMSPTFLADSSGLASLMEIVAVTNLYDQTPSITLVFYEIDSYSVKLPENDIKNYFMETLFFLHDHLEFMVFPRSGEEPIVTMDVLMKRIDNNNDYVLNFIGIHKTHEDIIAQPWVYDESLMVLVEIEKPAYLQHIRTKKELDELELELKLDPEPENAGIKLYTLAYKGDRKPKYCFGYFRGHEFNA